jgi:hypothetical protein
MRNLLQIYAGVLAVLLAASGANAAGTVIPLPYPYAPIPGSSQHNLAPTSSTALTVPNGALYATVQAAGASVRYTTDGTVPTASVGMTLGAGVILTLSGYPIMTTVRFISATGTLDVEYFQ